MKKRLSENQVSYLLKKGYSYKDIALYEQSFLDKMKTGLSNIKDKAVSAVKNNPGAAIGAGLGAISPVPGGAGIGAAIGGGLGKALSKGSGIASKLGKGAAKVAKGVAKGAVPFGNFQDLVGKKVKQLQGEGYSLEEAFGIVEDFANRSFGEQYLSENTSKLSKVNLSENELRMVEGEWSNYLSEQGLTPAEDPNADARKQAMIDAGMQGGGGPATPEQLARIQAALGGQQGPAMAAPDTAAPQTVVPPMQIDPQTVVPPAEITPQTQVPTPPGPRPTPLRPMGEQLSAVGRAASAIGKKVGQAAKKITNPASAAGAAAGAAAKALSKNEEMSPEKNHTALRDWTSKMKESLMQEKDYDGDGKVETGSQEYLGSRDKAIKKAMANEQGIKSVMRGAKNIAKKAGKLGKRLGKMTEKTVFYTDDKERVRKFDDGR